MPFGLLLDAALFINKSNANLSAKKVPNEASRHPMSKLMVRLKLANMKIPLFQHRGMDGRTWCIELLA